MSVYMKLLVVISLTLTLSHVDVHSARVRRSKPLTLTEKQKSDIVKKHNALRAQEGAADMEMMTWNETLAAAAAIKAAWCRTDLNKPPLPGTSFEQYGINTMYVTGKPLNLDDSIQYWYNRKSDYNYDTQTCSAEDCNVYTQVVWAKTRQVGCASHICDRVKNRPPRYRNVKLFQCNYVPTALSGHKPFKKGPACSKCEGGAGWCKDGLCNGQCTEAGKDCSCAAVCHNCATLNLTTCRCSCAKGWASAACSERCEQTSHYCNPFPGIPGWPPSWCNHPEHGSRVRHNCPVMCGLCEVDLDAQAGKCPPVYAPGAEVYKLGAKPAKLVEPDNNGSQHQQQCATVALLSRIILSLTITWKALL